MMNRISRTTIVVVFVVFIVLLSHQCEFITKPIGFFNGTPSAPKGFYVINPQSGALETGQYVIIPVPDPVQSLVYERGWIRPGTPLLKTVGALPGDQVTINDEGLFINGSFVGPVLQADREGLPLPQIRESFTIAQGQFLPISTYGRSFDGRYFGPVAIDSIKYKVVPFLTY